MVARDLRPFFFSEEPEAPFRALQVQGRCLMAMEAHSMHVCFLHSSFVFFPFSFFFLSGAGWFPVPRVDSGQLTTPHSARLSFSH